MIYWVKTEYDGYEVSSDGRVRSVDRYIYRKNTGALVFHKGKELVLQVDNCGYLRARLSVNSKKVSVKIHRLVAKAFIMNPLNLPQVNHLDGDKQNNCVLNLEWTNNSGNQVHAINSGLRKIYFAKESNAFTGSVEVYKDGKLISIISGNREMKQFGLDFRLVSACLKGKRKSHKGYTFKKILLQ